METSDSATRFETLRANGATTAATYNAASRMAKRSPGVAVYSDAGDGWVCESTYCEWRKRVVRVSISPSGERTV